jgi:hypothetical protein
VFRHESGATSTVLLTQFAPAPAVGFEAVVWGESGLLPMPPRPETALSGLLATANNARISDAVIPAVRAAYRSRCGSRLWRLGSAPSRG